MPFLNGVVQEYMSRQGKQIRPLLVILSAELLGKVNERTLHAGAAIEILHNATLVHDDVIDQSDLRRGKPTVNAVWDNHIAVLTGDYLVSRALQESTLAESLEIIRTMSRLADQLSEGELHQIFQARDHDFSMRKYARTIGMKTAILFESCVRMSAESVGISPEEASKLVRYAYYMGICFQIKDDVFDYLDNGKIGKPVGNDLREGKVTLPLLFALHASDKTGCQEIKSLLEKDELKDEDVKSLTDFAISHGGIEFSYRVMNRLREKALRCLKEYRDCEARKDLEEIFTFIIDRDH